MCLKFKKGRFFLLKSVVFIPTLLTLIARFITKDIHWIIYHSTEYSDIGSGARSVYPQLGISNLFLRHEE